MTRDRFQWILVGLIIGAAFALLGINVTSLAEAPKSGQDVVEYREKRLKSAGGAMQALGQYDGSNAEIAANAAKTIDDVSGELLAMFPEGSGPGGAGIEKTRAKPEIWTNWTDFQAKAKGLDDASTTLTAAVATNDVDQIKTALGSVGKACKACHETYRGPEE